MIRTLVRIFLWLFFYYGYFFNAFQPRNDWQIGWEFLEDFLLDFFVCFFGAFFDQLNDDDYFFTFHVFRLLLLFHREWRGSNASLSDVSIAAIFGFQIPKLSSARRASYRCATASLPFSTIHNCELACRFHFEFRCLFCLGDSVNLFVMAILLSLFELITLGQKLLYNDKDYKKKGKKYDYLYRFDLQFF